MSDNMKTTVYRVILDGNNGVVTSNHNRYIYETAELIQYTSTALLGTL